jgi:hypothetical protein
VNFRSLVIPSVLALGATSAHALVTSTWQVETFQQFDQGDLTSAFISSLGEIRPGWTTQKVALEGAGVWSTLRLKNGSILVGSDLKGAIYKVDGTASKKLLTIPGAIAVVAMVQLADGSVVAAAMPGDKLWKLDLAAGKASELVTLKGVETVWSLAAGSDGTIYAGTGPAGKLFAVKGGAAREVFATDDKRITAVTATSDGSIWFGTSERALVFRHDPKTGATRAMADFAGNEIGALAPYRDGVVVAASDIADPPAGPGKSADQIEAAEKPSAPKGQAAKAPDAGSKPGADKDAPTIGDPGRKGARKGKGALFRVGGDARLEQLHALTQTYFTSVVVDPAGVIYAAAADKGRVYSVEPDGAVATAIDIEERAVSQLLWDGGRLVLATDDTAALYRVTGRATDGKYVSEVFDAKAVSQFGRITWRDQGEVTIETRSGNTAKPAAGWSEWKAPRNRETLGGGLESGKIDSPTGRYLQFRAAFSDGDARLQRVSTYYLPQNQPTRIEEITVEPASLEALPTLKDLAAKPRSPLLKLKWKIDGEPHRVPGGAVAEVRKDKNRAFLWLHENGTNTLPATSPLTSLVRTGPRELTGWHMRGQTELVVRTYTLPRD